MLKDRLEKGGQSIGRAPSLPPADLFPAVASSLTNFTKLHIRFTDSLRRRSVNLRLSSVREIDLS